MLDLHLIVLHEFDGYDLEGLVGEILGGMGEVSGYEDGVAIVKGAQGGRLSDDVVFDMRFSQDGEEVVVPMVMHDHGRMGREHYLEHTDELIFEHQVMVGLGCDLDRWGR